MTDTVTKEKRSEIMSRIRGRDTKPELAVRECLDGRAFRYQPRNIPGNPDFGNAKRKLTVFVDGCFWHGCPEHFRLPKTNTEFWRRKIERNMERDKAVTGSLINKGYKVLRIWEHEIKSDLEGAICRINNLP